jgi:hypothetical protein
MGERIGLNLARRCFLDAIVTNRGSSSDCFVYIAGFKNVSLLGRVSPDSGEAVGLQFEADRKLIALVWIFSHRSLHLTFNPEHLLDVMPDLVRQHIGLREVSGRSKTPLEFVVKA